MLARPTHPALLQYLVWRMGRSLYTRQHHQKSLANDGRALTMDGLERSHNTIRAEHDDAQGRVNNPLAAHV